MNNNMRSWVKVLKADKSEFDYGFSMGKSKDQGVLRQVASDAVMLQVVGAEKAAVLAQFNNLPHPTDDPGPLTYYGDMAKFVTRHLRLIHNS